MKTQFTPIAMRCTQEQFDAIRPKLEKHGLKAKDLSRFSNLPYLINYRFKQINSITNYSERHDWERDLDIKHVYHDWDENVFLQACGIDVDAYSVSKDFILEAYESACSTWKSKIEVQFPELFQSEPLTLEQRIERIEEQLKIKK